jgi:predicted nucleic acid-binding protein
MDYADATLVALAEDIGTNLVFTTDQRDFSIYRIGGRQEFTLLPPA